MRIGQLARAAGVRIDTVRYYEKHGLLSPPLRGANGYRMFQQADLDRLLFIRRCRKLDMSLQEVRHLLAVMDEPDNDCGAVNQMIELKLAEVRERMTSLQALEQQLQALRDRCQVQTTAARCGILRELTLDADDPGGGETGESR